MSESSKKTTKPLEAVVLTVTNHFAPNSAKKVDYDEFAHHRRYGESCCDKSLYVPLAKQVAELQGKINSGLALSSSVALHTDKDYTFPDGVTGVDKWHVTFLDDRGLDIADVSEFKRYLEANADKFAKEIQDADTLELIKNTQKQIAAGQKVDIKKLEKLGNFGDLLTKYNSSIVEDNN